METLAKASTSTPLSYSAYLHLPELLNIQHPLATPLAHDEMLFITVHQACELWFKLTLFELVDARDQMMMGDLRIARSRLRRAHEIARLLVEQLDILDTISPQDFLRFRGELTPASGAQSVQFREIELVSGVRDPQYLEHCRWLGPEPLATLTRRYHEASLWDGFLHCLHAAGFACGTEAERSSALRKIAHDRTSYGDLWDLEEALVSHDQIWSRWRAQHALMVERQIGAKPGTGGSIGAKYLRSRVQLRFFPELWDMRSEL